MSTVLVTGGAGFLGSHVAETLIAQGRTVVILDDLSGGFNRNIPAGSEFIHGSVTDASFVQKLFARSNFDAVFHFAAYAAEGLSHHIRYFNYTNNVLGSISLINAAVRHNTKLFVYTSSIAVYGDAPLPYQEDGPLHPLDPYGIAKLAVELDLKAAYRYFGLPYIIFRPHNIYGERQNLGDQYRNAVGIFIRQSLEGQPLTIFGDGNQRRAFSYVGDVAPVIAGCFDKKEAWNRIFNIGASATYSVNEIADAVQKVIGVSTGRLHLPERKEVPVAYSDHTNLESVFGHSKMTPLKEGITAMVRWACTVPKHESMAAPEIEISPKLPSVWRKFEISQ